MTAFILFSCLALGCECTREVLVQAQVLPWNHTVHVGLRKKGQSLKTWVSAVLTERRDEGKTKSTGNTRRNVPRNWKLILYMLTIWQGCACRWDLKVSTSTTALYTCGFHGTWDMCQSTTAYSARMAGLVHAGHFSKCKNDTWIVICHVVPLKNTADEKSVIWGHHFLPFQNVILLRISRVV